jgi:hypothetical protein
MHYRGCTLYQRKQHMHNNMLIEISRLVCFLVYVLQSADWPCLAMRTACHGPSSVKTNCMCQPPALKYPTFNYIWIGYGFHSNHCTPSCTWKYQDLHCDTRSAPSTFETVYPWALPASGSPAFFVSRSKSPCTWCRMPYPAIRLAYSNMSTVYVHHPITNVSYQ